MSILLGTLNVNIHQAKDQKAPEFNRESIGDLCRSESIGAEKRIIFIETSGENCLRPRQACAVESAAMANPDMTIDVHMALNPAPGTPEVQGGYGLERNCQTMDILSKLTNVHIIREDLTQYFSGTPLESLMQSEVLEKSNFSFQHLSDAVRIAMIYKRGGIYLDLDVVVLRSLRCLRNMVGQVLSWDNSGIENGVLIFDKGHQLLNHFMNLMTQIYDPLYRETIGPTGFLQSFRNFCHFPKGNFDEFGQFFMCHNNVTLTVLPREAFFPIPFLERTRFYDPNFPLFELDNLQTSYVVHAYGSGHGAQVSNSSLYSFLAQRFCPAIYSASISFPNYQF